MSLASWKKEFYPETAEKAAKRGDVAACEHSLRKWEGALPENCERHGVEFGYRGVSSPADTGSTVFFNAATCALCERHVTLTGTCLGCPLSQTGNACGASDSVYWRSGLNPRPMIAALRKALAYAKREERKRSKEKRA